MLSLPKVLLLSEDAEESANLQEILGHSAFLSLSRDLSETKRNLEKDDCDVVFCAWSFYRGFWNGWLQVMRERYPDIPVVILSRNGGEREWLEVLEAGAFDLLAFPCQRLSVLGVVQQAMVSHEAKKLNRLAALERVERNVN